MALDRTQRASPYETLDPGNGATIIIDRWAVALPMTIAASTAETGSLNDPEQAGQRVSLIARSVGSGGTRAITAASALNQAGNTVMTFNASYDLAVLEAVPVNTGAYQWRIILNEGVVLS